jgi:vacuolar-type H+-ATPase subunit F/Vma7
MRRIVVLGEAGRVRGYRLAGATVVEARGSTEISAAWSTLPPDTVLLILTADAAAALRHLLADRPRLVWAVIP